GWAFAVSLSPGLATRARDTQGATAGAAGRSTPANPAQHRTISVWRRTDTQLHLVRHHRTRRPQRYQARQRAVRQTSGNARSGNALEIERVDLRRDVAAAFQGKRRQADREGSSRPKARRRNRRSQETSRPPAVSI